MLWTFYHDIEIWSAMILNIMMNKSILEVDDIEVCSAEVLKFCTSLAPKIPSNPWQNIANITENLLIVVSTSFVVLFVNHVSKKERIQIWNGKPSSHFFSFWYEIIFGSMVIQKCTWLTGLTTVWGGNCTQAFAISSLLWHIYWDLEKLDWEYEEENCLDHRGVCVLRRGGSARENESGKKGE